MLPVNDPRVAVYAQPTLCFQTTPVPDRVSRQPAQYAGMPNALTASQAGNFSLTSSRPGRVFYSTNRFCNGCTGLTGARFPDLHSDLRRGLVHSGGGGGAWLDSRQCSCLLPAGNSGVDGAVGRDRCRGDRCVRRSARDRVSRLAWLVFARSRSRSGSRLYTDGVEAWAEWRRTCVPATVIPGPDAVIAYGAAPVPVFDAGALGKLGEPGRGCRAAGSATSSRRECIGIRIRPLPRRLPADVSGSGLRSAALTTDACKRRLAKERKPPGFGRLSFLSEVSAAVTAFWSRRGPSRRDDSDAP